MNIKTLTILLMTAQAATAGTYYAPTLPGSNIPDYSRRGWIVDGNTAYQTQPGSTVKDFSAPGYTRQGDTIYPTMPGSSIPDWSEPGYRIERRP